MESGPVIRQYWLRQAGNCHAGTDVHELAAADRAGGRGRQLDPRRRAALCRQRLGRDQADAAGARDRQCRTGGHRRPVLEPHEADLRELVEATPDLTLAELQTTLQRAAASGPGSRRSTTRCAGSACGKKKSLRAAEQDRPDVAGERRLWRGWQRFMDPARLVFLDETATATTMTSAMAAAPRVGVWSPPRATATGAPPRSSPGSGRPAS